MSIEPIITFKAGLCDLDASTTPPKVKPKPTPGYIYLYREDELIHFCWRPRSAPLTEPKVDLMMVPCDGSFIPYDRTLSTNVPPTSGRIFLLKFSSSSLRQFFWLQSKSQHESGDLSWFSPKDRKLGEIVHTLLQGEEVNVQREIASVQQGQGGRDGGGNHGANSSRQRDQDGDDDMGDSPSGNYTYTSSDSWWRRDRRDGFDPSGGSAREGGEELREGNVSDSQVEPSSSNPSSVIQNLLKSLQGNHHSGHRKHKDLFTTLSDLLPPSITLQLVESADEKTVDHLLSFLSPSLLLLSQNIDEVPADSSAEMADAVMQSLELTQKKDILKRVLRSPQFTQSLGSLTIALREGGLPSISEALHVQVENGGFTRRGGVPLGGGEAVEVFLEGIRRHVEGNASGAEEHMETGD